MSAIPDLNKLIKAIECEEWKSSVCSKCEYSYIDDSGDHPIQDHPIQSCNEEKIKEETLFYLKLYQYLIEGKNNE